MPKKHVIEFTETDSPITDPVTNFGGQPVWIAEPAWPLSRETGNPMRFIGQVELREEYGFNTPAKLAYLFMTEEEDDSFVDGTYEPDGGENAVILQPGNPRTPTIHITGGPTLFKMVEVEAKERLQKLPCEFSVHLVESDDIVFVSEEYRFKLSCQKIADTLNGEGIDRGGLNARCRIVPQ